MRPEVEDEDIDGGPGGGTDGTTSLGFDSELSPVGFGNGGAGFALLQTVFLPSRLIPFTAGGTPDSHLDCQSAGGSDAVSFGDR